MRTLRVLSLLLSISLATPVVPAPAQTPADDDRWQIAIESGDYIWDIRLVRLHGDSLVYRQSDSLGSVAVQQIRELRLIRKTTMRIGEGAGAGGAIGALTGADDEIYDLQTLDFPARLRAIQQILLVHPPKT
jgi:hypothetical protein